MKDLSELTIIVPSYNRQSYLIRQMNMWRKHPVKLHLLDGSHESINKNALINQGKNIFYHHMPYSISKRLEKIIDHIETAYVILLSDDEFFIPSALEKACYYLHYNKQHVACQGLCLGFDYFNGEVYAEPTYNYLIDYIIDSPLSNERMSWKVSSEKYGALRIYSVVRSDVFINNMRIICKNNYSSSAVPQFQFELATRYQGMSNTLKELFWLRSAENMPLWEKTLNFRKWLNNPNMGDEIELFKKDLADRLAQISNSQPNIVYNQIEEALYTFLSCKKSVDTNHVKKYIKYLKKLYIIMFNKMVKNDLENNDRSKMPFYNNVNNATTWSSVLSKEAKPLLITAKELTKKGVSVDSEEIERIRKLIVEFHQ